jgi:hypothetical protein
MAEPADYWDSDTRQAYARQLHASILALNHAIAAAPAGSVPPGDLIGWRAFRESWAKWYGSAGALTWSLNATVVAMTAYAAELGTWQKKYTEWTRQVAPSGELPSASSWSPLYWTLAIAGAGYLFMQTSYGRSVAGRAASYAKPRRSSYPDFDFELAPRRGGRRRK